MIIVAAVSMTKGEPKRLFYGKDNNGDTCGIEGRGTYIVYPRINEDIVAAGSKVATGDIRFYGVCVDECPKEGEWVCDAEGEKLLEGGKLNSGELEECVDRTFAKGGAFLYRDPG